MRKLIVHEFVTLDGVMQAPGGKDEDRDGGFEYGGWTLPYWHDDIGKTCAALMKDADAFLLGRRTYVTHAAAFEPMPAGDFFGDMMNAPKKYVVSKTLKKPTWRDTTIIRDNVIESVRALKAQPGKNILTDGSSQLVHALLEHDLVDESINAVGKRERLYYSPCASMEHIADRKNQERGSAFRDRAPRCAGTGTCSQARRTLGRVGRTISHTDRLRPAGGRLCR